MLKQCKVCDEAKSFDPTAKKDSKASGFYGKTCWTCYLVVDLDVARAASKRWRDKHPEKASAAKKSWCKQHPEKVLAAKATYRAAKRMPLWADEAKIEQVYAQARAQGLEVDHVVPLNGKTVSGLHVENNLQLLSRKANAAKSNRWEH